MSGFWVLLGGDSCGKSEVLRQLGGRGWRTVSYDDAHAADVPVVRRLVSSLFFDAYTCLDRPYSRELTFSLLTPVVWYLRDEALRQAALGPTLVDSYYFKLLAKGRLTGIADPATAALWRSLPQPDGVVFLDVDPELAWARSGGELNPFEHYDREPTRDGFIRYQRDLREAMLHEVRHLDMRIVPADRSRDLVAERVRASIRDRLPASGLRT